MRKIFFDIETRNTFQEVGSNDPVALDISVVCTYDSETGTYESFLQEDFPRLWKVLEKADMFVTFNGDHFDIPLLDKYYPGDLSQIKSLDLLVEVKKSLGRRIKLDTLAEATLGKNKIAHGLEAITWWREGKIDEIIKYCLEDVKITKEIYDFARARGGLYYIENTVGGTAEKKGFKIDTSRWEEPKETAMTFTLPF